MPETEPEVLSEEIIYRGRIVSLKKIQLKMPEGAVVTREIVEHHGSVGILPVNDEGKILFVRQYRPPTGRRLLELPAGSLEEGEEPEACARRELTEEVGFAAREMRRVAGFYLAPGWATEFMHGFIATGLYPEKTQGDEDEDIEIVPLTPAEALAAARRDEIADAKSLALLGMYMAEQR